MPSPLRQPWVRASPARTRTPVSLSDVLNSWREWLQVTVIVVAALYALRALARSNSAGRHAAHGIGALLAVYGGLKLLGLTILTGLLESAFQMGLLAMVILFHEEARAWLVRIGKRVRRLVRLANEDEPSTAPRVVEEIANGLERIAAAGAGALVVVEMGDPLDDYIEPGYVVNGVLTSALLEAIFISGSPIHDGAVIVRGPRILAAGAVLPLHEGPHPDLIRRGLRHRAAMGISHATDAAAIVVSEDRGTIKVARDGAFIALDREHLRRELVSILTHAGEPDEAPAPRRPLPRAAEQVGVWALRAYKSAGKAIPGTDETGTSA